MTSNEAKMMLFESLLHSKNTRVDFFINKQKELGITPLNFISDLLSELENLYERVNTITYKSWEIDEITKKKKYHKQIILLNTETNGLMYGQIDCNNIFEISEPLLEYGRLIQDKSEKKKSQKKTSYLWLNNPKKELLELYKLLNKDYNLIASETTFEQLEAVFTGQSIDDIIPIKWHQNNATELLYFIENLIKTDNIVGNKKRSDYKKMTACFVMPNGKKFDSNFKQLKIDFNYNLSEKKRKAISELINNFL
jgi:hypothetical protein